MMKPAFFLLITLLYQGIFAQTNYYYPPGLLGTWETTDPASLNWDADSLDALQQFLGDKHSKSFIILKEGKIVVEWYFDSFTQDSLWYWASAGKTMTASLIGIAQAEGYLDIQDTTSTYLGKGWTSCDSAEEATRTIWHQLTMTTAFDDEEFDCIDPVCLQCLAPAGTRWSYHNGPYTLLSYVLEAAVGTNINQYMNNRLMLPIGGLATYVKLGSLRIILSNTRTMARFGHLILSQGNWNGNQIIDSAWVYDMTHPSQTLNPSYGYLWWLNGQGSYRLPGSQLLFPGNLIPTAPDDMFAGLGKNDQKVYVVPSLDMVVIRLGNEAEAPNFALSSFDAKLWEKIMNLDQGSTSGIVDQGSGVRVFPVPAGEEVQIESQVPVESWTIYSLQGQNVSVGQGSSISLSGLSPGTYVADIQLVNGARLKRKVIRE